jgi:hypothetical protein
MRFSVDPKKVKIQLSDQLGNIETLWADALGGDLYRLDNSPWFAYNISSGDIVEARSAEPNGLPIFVKTVEKSGVRTIRLLLNPPADKSRDSQSILDRLCAMGCTYEGAHPGAYAIDIPPSVDLEAVRIYLISTGQQWEHGDPRYDDLFPTQDESTEPAG